MYVVRVDFKGGLHREYGYADMGVAMGAYQAITQARRTNAPVEIIDEGGRQAFIDAREVVDHEIVDVGKETHAAIVLLREIQDIQRKAGLIQPLVPQSAPEMPPGRDDAPEYRGAIGRAPSFAN